MDNPSIVRNLPRSGCVDTVHAARQVSFAPAGVRIRQVASATGQSWLGGAPNRDGDQPAG
jgi:hypothetical protein